MKINWKHINDFKIGDTVLNKKFNTIYIKKYMRNFYFALPEDWNKISREEKEIINDPKKDFLEYCGYKILLIEKFDKNKIKFDFISGKII